MWTTTPPQRPQRQTKTVTQLTKDRIYAIAGTVIFHLIVLLAIIFTCLTYPPAGWKELPPQPSEEIVFEPVEDLYASGEFVRTGDIADPVAPVDEPAPSDVTADVPTQDAPDLENHGEAATPPKVTTSERPSPAKVKKEPKGPTKEELEKERQRQEAKKQQQTKKNVAQATAKAFGGGKGKGTPGAAEGSGSKGNVVGTPGNGLAGRTIEHFTSVRGKKLGTIAVRVKVDSQGRVTSASYYAAKSSGTAAGDPQMRQACVQRSRECRFSVLEGSPVQTGIITWVFE